MQLSLFTETFPVDEAALAACLRADVVAVDVETETRWPGYGPRVDFGLSYAADVTVIALAWRGGEAFRTTAVAAPFEEPVRRFLNVLFTGTYTVVAHNAVFDIRQLSRLTEGQLPTRIWDTQVMARLLRPVVNASYSLIGAAGLFGIPVPEQQQAMKSQRSRLHSLPMEQVLAYAQDDARLALELYETQRAVPFDAELIDWECRAVYEYCAMAVRGIRLNVPYVEPQLVTLEAQREARAKRLRLDGLYEPSSPKARARYLYETKGIALPVFDPDSMYFTRAGRKRLLEQPGTVVLLSDLSTRSDVVESYMGENSPYREQLGDLAAYMEIDWLISTLRGLVEHAVIDGRLHSLVTIATESGRRASSYPHMQNWKMPAMAGVAIGDEGFTLVEIDYSNAENIMAALISGDSNLAVACAAEDFHATMAERYFGETWEEADPASRKRLRTMSKKITYGTAYGMGAERLGDSIGVSTDEAKRLIRAKDTAFPNVARTRDAAKRQARDTQQLALWTGRPVAVPSAFVAWNYLCQGGVSEALKRALILVSEAYRERGMRSRVALDMHDALILEVAHEEWSQALDVASQIMSNITPEALNQRTTPPIHFRAAPDVAENQKKWGAQQWHPTIVSEKAAKPA